jgi:hypothetical protein
MTVESAEYDTRRERWWELAKMPFDEWDWTIVGGTEIVAFTLDSVYSLKLKLGLQPPTVVMLTSTARVNRSMLSRLMILATLRLCVLVESRSQLTAMYLLQIMPILGLILVDLGSNNTQMADGKRPSRQM